MTWSTREKDKDVEPCDLWGISFKLSKILVTFVICLTFLLTIENLKTLQSKWHDNKEWHWTAFAIFAIFYKSLLILLLIILKKPMMSICKARSLMFSQQTAKLSICFVPFFIACQIKPEKNFTSWTFTHYPFSCKKKRVLPVSSSRDIVRGGRSDMTCHWLGVFV